MFYNLGTRVKSGEITKTSEYDQEMPQSQTADQPLNLFEAYVHHNLTIFYQTGSAVVECLTQDREAMGSSLTGLTALWSLSKTHLSKFSTGSTQEDPFLFY